MRTHIALAGMAALAFCGPAFAHHSFSMFDAEKTLTIEGTVKEFEFINPHAWLYIMALDSSGKAVEWSIEMGGSGALTRTGWKPDTVKPGDRVSVQIHPLKDGSRGGQYLTAKLPDGRMIEGGDSGLPPIAR
jgi:hypothetical protein